MIASQAILRGHEHLGGLGPRSEASWKPGLDPRIARVVRDAIGAGNVILFELDNLNIGMIGVDAEGHPHVRPGRDSVHSVSALDEGAWREGPSTARNVPLGYARRGYWCCDRLRGMGDIGAIVAVDLVNAFDTDTRRMVQGLFAHVGALIGAWTMLEQQRKLVVTDSLTGARNRLGFREDVERALASREPHTCFYLDLDGFKAINDTRGHKAGDEVLKLVVKALDEAVRPGDDSFARLAGDEFAVLVRGTVDPQTMATRFERAIRTAGVGVSVGWTPVADSVDDTLNRADKEMYNTKALHHKKTA